MKLMVMSIFGVQMALVYGIQQKAVFVCLGLGALLFLLKKSVRAKVRGCEHLVLRHLSKRRLEWAFCLGGLFLVLFYVFHEEIFKFGAEVMSVPAMEALLSRGAELE